jgi:outer membrane lipoprotein-sorting protein
VDEKSQQIIDKAVQSVGGPAYLNVSTVTGKGFYTTFNQGLSQLPAKFLDYVAYPDRERTEFIGGGIKTINTNDGDKGWLFDGAVKTITDQGPSQIEDFKRAMRTSLEYVLRGWWKKEGGKILYVGRREAGLAKRNETIRVTYPSGFWVEYEFGAKDGLPAKIIYKRVRKNMDSGDEEETTEEDQFFKFITIDGVNAPWVIDHFINGHQSSRINYESIQYNQKLADSLFAKPDNVKANK